MKAPIIPAIIKLNKLNDLFLIQLVVFRLFRYNLYFCMIFGFKYIVSSIYSCLSSIFILCVILDSLNIPEALDIFLNSKSNNTFSDMFTTEFIFSNRFIL